MYIMEVWNIYCKMMNIVELCILQMLYILGVYDTCKWDMCSSPYPMLLWKKFDINSEYKTNELATMTRIIMCK